MTDRPCSVRSLARSEPMYGTASTVRAFLLVEVPGPWGKDALRDARIPPPVRTALRQRCHALGVRPLLIRRHGRTAPTRSRVFLAYADPHQPWLETTRLDQPGELLDLDLDVLAAGRTTGLPPTDQSLFLTCTHGRHDRCCAERGRPVAAALARSHPTESWEVSHIGGDRFAGNLLVLPDGLYYGRLAPGAAVALATRHHAGHLDLSHLRGRSGYGFAVQAAEWFLRSELEVTGRRALRLEASTARDAMTEATFLVEGRRWRVRVAREETPPALLTCGAQRANPIPIYELLRLERLQEPPG